MHNRDNKPKKYKNSSIAKSFECIEACKKNKKLKTKKKMKLYQCDVCLHQTGFNCFELCTTFKSDP